MNIDIEKIKEDNQLEIVLEEGALKDYTYTLLSSTVAQTIIKYRKRMGYTQKDLAGILKISQARIAKIEDGINITLKTLCDINEKIETKEYSFILDVLNNLQISAKKLRKENYYTEITKVIEYTNLDYLEPQNEEVTFGAVEDYEINYSETYQMDIA